MTRPSLVISGGQTGADQGALAGAKRLGVATGGWMPRGFLTELGPAPDLALEYGLREHRSPKYPPRTRQNVKDACLTVWLGHLDEPGYRCTKAAANALDKPFLANPEPSLVRACFTNSTFKVLNVAGPRASRDADAYERTLRFVMEAFQ